jgi:predicted HNH restriction endonuclease
LHTERERDSKVIRLAKNLAKQLSCEACGFDFGKFYGERGEGYIEGHHTKPIAEMKPRGEETIVKDIALVCSNCHRMLHRMRPLITIDELKQRINEQRVKSLK